MTAGDAYKLLGHQCVKYKTSTRSIKSKRGKRPHKNLIFRFNEDKLPNLCSGSDFWEQEYDGEDSAGVVRRWKADVSEMVFFLDLISGELSVHIHYQVELCDEETKNFGLSN